MVSKKNAPIAITSGDPRGIGPEVIAKGLYALRKKVPPSAVVIFGDPGLYKPFKKFFPKTWHAWSEHEFLTTGWKPDANALNFIVGDRAHGCGRYIELATQGALAGKFSALTTGPIDKNVLRDEGYAFDGHTEMLQSICKSPSVTMMMAGRKMRTTLVTTHDAIKDVSARLSEKKILTCIENTALGLQRDFGIKKPRLAVLGLNPHAGDQGLFGTEEKEKIEPAIAKAKERFFFAKIEGPFPPDGFFAQWFSKNQKLYDAVVCMYHDQGLIPIKLIDFENTVNVSLGLPIIRTSVDHGVGYDIAGTGKADPSSFRAALSLALDLVKTRRG